MGLNDTLGNYIYSIRKDLKLNQQDFCDKLDIDITRASLSKIESGKQMPSAEFIKNVVEAFNISPYKLLDIIEPIEERDIYIDKYLELNNKDKQTVNIMIDHLYGLDKNLYTSKNIEEIKENKKSS